MTLEEARELFPVLEKFAYLNAGTFGPLPAVAGELMREQDALDVERGRSGKPYFEAMIELRASMRARVAALVSAQPEQVALTSSTTDGCNIVLAGLGLGPDDEVVTTDGEHFGLLGALASSPAQVRVAAVRDLPPEESLEVLIREGTPKTKLFALSHVCWMSGNRFPAAELREATGVPVLVDGAQSAGAIEVDATAFDFFAFSCQKWLCGPDATGGLVVRDPERLRVTAPSYLSQQAYEPTGEFTPREGAARYDSNWTAVPSLAGLSAALDAAPEGGFERALEMAERCRALLGERVVTATGQATLVAFRVDGEPAELVSQLYEAGVVVRSVPGEPWIRVSCGWWTSDEDLERLVSALPQA